MDTRENSPADKALLDQLDALPDRCGYNRTTKGFWCSRVYAHDGPCAAHPVGGHSGKDPVPEEDQPFEGGCFKGVLIVVGLFLLTLALFWWWMLKG